MGGGEIGRNTEWYNYEPVVEKVMMVSIWVELRGKT